MHKPDHLLEFEVREEFEWDPELDDSRIIVKADDGVITLSGAVESLPDLARAARDAGNITGVKAVGSRLLVGFIGAVIADHDISAGCAAVLQADRFVPPGAVMVAVTDGWVTLTGKVHNHHQRQAARHAVGRVPGVRGVDNQVTLTDEPIPADVAERIEKALARKAILADSRVKVSSAGHTVYLDGTTGSCAALAEAVDTAWSVPGVNQVVNRLVVDA
ncbi:MAG: BON domain-containing protein [Acidimicrobiales bacterium]|jgi:osmotically-inducible protein OsmY